MRAAKVDANQAAIVSALRQTGMSVLSLHRHGQGVPDLLLGFRGLQYLVEVKTEKERLNDLQKAWIQRWHGHVIILRSVEEALEWRQSLI